LNRTAFLFALFAFAAGGTIGFVAGRGSDPATPSRPPELSLSTDSATDTAPPDRDVGGRETGRRIAGGGRGSGTGSSTVVVRTEEGEPLAGVLARATPNRGGASFYDRSGRPPEDRPVGELAAELVERTRRERAERVEAVTGDDGTCVLTGLGDREYSIEVYREGFRFRSENATRHVRPGGEARFRAQAQGSLEVRVLRPDGREPESATVDFAGKVNQGYRPWRPDRREVWSLPGEWTLTAEAGEAKEYRSEPVEVSVEPESRGVPVVVRLEERTGIRGRVVLPPGDLRPMGELRALRLTEGEEADTRRILDRDAAQDVRLRGNGEFSLLDLEPGAWLVALVTHDEVIARQTATVTRGLAECVIEVPAPDPADSVIVDVLGPNGRPTSGVYLLSELHVGDRAWAGPAGIPLRDGGYRVRHAGPGDGFPTTGGSYVLRVSSQRYGEVERPYSGPGAARFTIRLAEPGSLTVTLAGYRGSGHEGHVKALLRSPAGSAGSVQWRTDKPFGADGRYVASPLEPGDYELVVYTVVGSQEKLPALARPITVAPGDNEVEIPMPDLCTLTVLCEVPKMSFRIEVPGWPGTIAHTSSRRVVEGRVVWEHVPAGEYRIQPIFGPSSREIPVRVPQTLRVKYDPTPDNAFEVRIMSDAGSLARAGLRDGDLIVAIDGEELTDGAQMQALRTLAEKKEKTRLTVLRGRERIGIEADLSDRRSWGGSLSGARR
jgi:hypothetical protein